ncbi:MAG: DUF2764 family protein, partial [Cocleimonas sp.]
MKYPTNCKYTMLVTSLPAHKSNLFDEKQTPLSRIQLNKRLALLDEKDAADLLKIEQLLHWSHIKTDINQTFVKESLESINSINNDFINHLIIWRLELRIILAALRMRHFGQKTPPTKKISGFDYWYFVMTKYWHQPDLGLAKQLPWLPKANELLVANESYQLEKFLLGVVWDHYNRLGLGHYFNFEAVIIYVLRWDIIDRWTSYNKEIAIQRFNDLIDVELQ